jgi:probable HAF family extracellular repeat protein
MNTAGYTPFGPRTFTGAIIVVIAMVVTLVCSTIVRAEDEYEFSLIEAFDVDYDLREVILRDINEAGLVTGTATHNGFYDGFVWSTQTEKVVVPMLWPQGVNNLNAFVSDGLIYDLDTGTSITVPPAGGYPVPRLQAINDNGIAVGYSECACSNSGHTVQTALVWDGASRTIPVPAAKELLRINNGNFAVGNIRGGSAGSEGFLYSVVTGAYTNMTDMLPPYQFGRGWSELQDLSETNTVTGRGWDGEFRRGLTWSEATGFTFLPALPGGLIDRVYPRGINASGTVVGFADLTPQSPHAFVWTPQSGMRDLNDLVTAPPGFVLDWAIKINDQGWIIGIGHYGLGWGTSRGFVLRPMNAATPVDDRVTSLAGSWLRISPNPASDNPVMHFVLPKAGLASLSVFDVAGHKIATVLDRSLSAGPHVIAWSAAAAHPAGVYYARLETPGSVRVERFVLLR